MIIPDADMLSPSVAHMILCIFALISKGFYLESDHEGTTSYSPSRTLSTSSGHSELLRFLSRNSSNALLVQDLPRNLIVH